MPTRDSSRYSGNQEPLDHQDDAKSTWEAQHHPGANRREDWAPNPLPEALLEKLDGHAAAVFKYQHNLAAYEPADRRAVIDSYTDAFKNTDFDTATDRHAAAAQAAATVFNPLFRQIELQEFTHQSDDPHVLQTLKYDGIADNVSPHQLQEYERKFTTALYNNSVDPSPPGDSPDQVLDHAIAYYKQGEPSGSDAHLAAFQKDPVLANYEASTHVWSFNQARFSNMRDRFDAAHDEAEVLFTGMYDHVNNLKSAFADDPQTFLSQTRHTAYQLERLAPARLDYYRDHFSSTLFNSDSDPEIASALMSEILNEAQAYVLGRTSYHPDTDTLDFRSAKDMNTPDLKFALDAHIDGNWHSAFTAAIRQGTGATRSCQGLAETYALKMRQAIEQNDEAELNTISDHMTVQNYAFALNLKNQTGFITAENHQPPPLPEQFDNPADAGAYLSQVQQTLEDLRHADHSTEPIYLEAVDTLVKECLTELAYWNEDLDLCKENPDYRVPHEMTHDVAKGINLLLQPQKPS